MQLPALGLSVCHRQNLTKAKMDATLVQQRATNALYQSCYLIMRDAQTSALNFFFEFRTTAWGKYTAILAHRTITPRDLSTLRGR